MPQSYDIQVDLRQEVKDHIKIKVQIKNIWRVRLGILFIRIGCYLSGAQYVEEFPMSLLQDDKEVTMQ